jgi:hypothetical protein
MANIVQAEFCHVDARNAPSLRALLAECMERLVEGLDLTLSGKEHRSGIKTVVRFYDETGALTALTQQAKKVAADHEELVLGSYSAGWLQRKLLNRRHRKLVEQKISLRKDCRVATYQYLREAIQTSKEIAIEKSNHRFRMARREELHELYESVASTNSMWLFIFRPNDLLADQNTLVTNLW